MMCGPPTASALCFHIIDQPGSHAVWLSSVNDLVSFGRALNFEECAISINGSQPQPMYRTPSGLLANPDHKDCDDAMV
eukprot:10346468-Lingulodinium_polyedra.AAC.1